MSEPKKLAEKLLEIQKKITPLIKDSDNPYFQSKFADLNQVLALAKEHLNKAGILITQGPGILEGGHRYVETSLIDVESGQAISCRVPYSGHENNMQQIGAATTYGRRFGLISLLALEQDDDDGETAVGRGKDVSRTHEGTKAVPKAAGKSPAPEAKPSSPKADQTRETLLKKISLTSKVIVDSKRDTQENVMALLKSFKVKSKEELSDEQANNLLIKLEEKLK